jgi:F-type H+-transporting ATPase subunit b
VCFLVLLAGMSHRSYAQETAAQTAQPAKDAKAATEATGDPDANPPDEKDQYMLSPSTVKIAGWLHMQPRVASKTFELLNFAIVFLAIYFGLKKVMPKMLKDRGDRIEKQLVEARAATEDANRRMQAVEERLAKLDDEIIAMQQQSERDMQAEEERFRATLETEKTRIIESTEQEVAAAGAAARRDLKRFAADLAVSAAEQRLQMTASLDEEILGQFAHRLAGHGAGEKN